MSAIPIERLAYKPEEVAEMLDVSVATVKRLLQSKELRGIKVRGQWRIRVDEFSAYLERISQ